MKHVIRTTSIVVLVPLAMMAVAQGTKSKPKTAQPLTLAAPTAALGGMVGTWTMRDGDKPLTYIKMIFRPNGTFAFAGPNWQSTGSFRVQEHRLCLEWATVDGAKVAPGTMKKNFAMAEDETSFTIDKYTYFKLQR